MVEIRSLTEHRDEDGRIMIDEEEIHAMGYTDPRLKSMSLDHVRALMAKLVAG